MIDQGRLTQAITGVTALVAIAGAAMLVSKASHARPALPPAEIAWRAPAVETAPSSCAEPAQAAPPQSVSRPAAP